MGRGGISSFFSIILGLLGLLAPTLLFAEPVSITWMIRRHIPAVLSIAQESFETPWSEDEFLFNLRKTDVVGMVAERNGKVVGYMVYDLSATKVVLLNFAVASEARNTTVGSQMLERVIRRLSGLRRDEIILDIPADIQEAQGYFEAKRFRKVINPEEGYGPLKPNETRMRYRIPKVGTTKNLEQLEQRDFYEQLDIPMHATLEQIEAAYKASRTLSKGKPEAQRIFEQAYLTLKDPVRRAKYDDHPASRPAARELPDSVMEEYAPSENLAVISAQPESENYYQRFGLPENIDQSKIIDRYITLANQFNTDPQALVKLAEAFAVLRHPITRAAYDRQERRRQQPGGNELVESLRAAAKLAKPSSSDLYERTGIPPESQIEKFPEYLDSALLEHAADGAARGRLVDARDRLDTLQKKVTYDLFRLNLKAVADAFAAISPEESVQDYLRRMLEILPLLKGRPIEAKLFLKHLEQKTVTLLNKPPSADEVEDLVRLVELFYFGAKIPAGDFSKSLRTYRSRLATVLFGEVAQSRQAQLKIKGFYGRLVEGEPIEWLFIHAPVKPVVSKTALAQSGYHIKTPREVERARVEKLLDSTYHYNGWKNVGLLENPERPGTIMPFKAIAAASLGLWTTAIVFPEQIGMPLLEWGNSHLLMGIPLYTSVSLAGIYGIYAGGHLPNLIRRGLLQARLKWMNAVDQPVEVKKGDSCGGLFSRLFGR